MAKVGEHQESLYELDTRLLFLNKMLMSTMQAVSYPRYCVTILTDIHLGIILLTSGILGLKENMDVLYEFLRVSASHKMKPLIVPPDNLCNILLKVKHDMRTNPRLELPDDPD